MLSATCNLRQPEQAQRAEKRSPRKSGARSEEHQRENKPVKQSKREGWEEAEEGNRKEERTWSGGTSSSKQTAPKKTAEGARGNSPTELR